MLLPKKTLTIRSAKTEEAIMRTLRSMTEEVNTRWKIKDRSRLFYGVLETQGFVVHTVPEYLLQRSFLLEIRGRIRREDDAVVVELELRPERFVRIFFPFYVGFCAFFLVALLLSSVREPLPFLILFAMALFAFLLVRVLFQLSSERVIKALTDTLS